ncbi:hypothetical protein [Streptomyces erythrochromogenes]
MPADTSGQAELPPGPEGVTYCRSEYGVPPTTPFGSSTPLAIAPCG